MINEMKSGFFSAKIVEWYAEHQRDLPWRSTRDPYKIWLSEIILQQTRVLQGLPYYLKFVRRYPTVGTLALAREQDILRLWQGLGYYSRARNLRKCAQTVHVKYRGKFPETFKELRTLSGIGDYTAAAIASISFQEAVAVVDGNVFRVLARVFGIDKDITTTAGKKFFAELANQLLSRANPALHNQAVMEFGALQCVPRNPRCETCIFQGKCVANRSGLQHELPIKAKTKKARHRYFYYLLAHRGKKFMMKKRTESDIWRGLFDFPLYETPGVVAMQQIPSVMFSPRWLRRREGSEISISREYRHVLSHQVIHARFVSVEKFDENALQEKDLILDSRFYSAGEVAQLPKPVLISRYLLEQGVL